MDKGGQRWTKTDNWILEYCIFARHNMPFITSRDYFTKSQTTTINLKKIWQNLKEQTFPMTRQNSDVKNRIFCLRPSLFSFTSRSLLVRSSFVSRCSLVRYSLVYRRPIEDRTRNKQKTNERTTRKQRKNNEKLSRSYQNPPNYWQKTEKGNSLDDKQ